MRTRRGSLALAPPRPAPDARVQRERARRTATPRARTRPRTRTPTPPPGTGIRGAPRRGRPPPGRAPAPESTSGPARPTIGTTAVLRPSVWSLPVVFFRAVRTALWIRPWIVRTFDPHFDGEEILRGAAAAHPVVLAAFAGNDMRLLRDACGDAAFDAFRDAERVPAREHGFVRARARPRLVRDVDDDVDPTAGAILVDAGVYAEGDDEEAAAHAIAGVALAQTRGGEDGSGFDLGETIRLRLSATVRFQLVEEWTLVDTVTGERGVTTDARGHVDVHSRSTPTMAIRRAARHAVEAGYHRVGGGAMHVVSYRGYVLTSSPNAARARTARVGGSGAPGALSLARARATSRGGRVVRRTRVNRRPRGGGPA